MLNKIAHEKLQEFANNNGFKKRGKLYFRVIGDGILQQLKFEYERRINDYVLDIGLKSMYGELERSDFTSSGAIPQYGVTQYIGEMHPVIVTNEEILIPTKKTIMHTKEISSFEQYEILEQVFSDRIDNIKTQQQLIDEMFRLESETKRHSLRWNDMYKFAPFVKIGDYEKAEKVLKAILDQHQNAIESRKKHLSIADYEAYSKKEDLEDAPLKFLYESIKNRNEKFLTEYLNNNYKNNCIYAGL